MIGPNTFSVKRSQKSHENKDYSIQIQVYSIQTKKNIVFYQSTATSATVYSDLHMTSLPFTDLRPIEKLFSELSLKERQIGNI